LQKTHAHHKHVDDVPYEVKTRRVDEVVEAFRKETLSRNQSFIGTNQLVLVEGLSKRSNESLAGRNEFNTKVIFPKTSLPDATRTNEVTSRPIQAEDYVIVKITDCNSQTLTGTPLSITSATDYFSGKHPEFMNTESRSMTSY